MGLWDKIRGEFIDIIEWTDDSPDTLVWRFERYGNEIKYGAQLTVRPGQAAVFVNEGQIADMFEPGMHRLETQNLPVLSTLLGWKYGFSSPFKAEVYFISTRQFTDLKWGTKNPVMLRDQEFGPVRLRAFGTYAIRAKDPKAMIEQIVGTDGHFTTDEITNQLRNLIITRFTDLLGESKIPVLDLAANYDELSTFVRDKISPEFGAYGLDLTTILVENISLPPAVEAELDKRTSMGVVGDLRKYTQFQMAQAMKAAAENPGGMAGGGMGMGMGFAMANQMGNAMGAGMVTQGQQPQQPQQQTSAPPPIPGQVEYFIAINGQATGPFDMDALKERAARGEVARDSLVWKQGMAHWTEAGQVSELNAVWGPPPIPGGGPPPIPGG